MKKPSKSEPDWLERFVNYLETQNGQRVAICAFSIVAVIVLAALPGGILAYVFGIPFMFFIPGFAVVRMFFWKDNTPEARFVLSLGISILVVVLLGLLLVLTPIGLDQNTTRASLIVFSLAAVASETFWLRADRGVSDRQARQRTAKPVVLDLVVIAMLATALVVSAISLGLIVTAKYPSRTYFAVTDASGHVLANTTLVEGTNLTLVVHIKNGEDGQRNFTLVSYKIISGSYTAQNFSRTLNKNELWDQAISFNLTPAGYQRVDFDLYIQKGSELPYHYGNLHIWLVVNPAGT
jgi:uncharacterized membrane protein